MASFISIEGLDGSGKSTLFSLLIDHLPRMFPRKHFIFIKDPENGPIRDAIMDTKDGKSKSNELLILLFAAARRQSLEKNAHMMHSDKTIFIFDRFVDSTLAYQGGYHDIDSNIRYINWKFCYDIIPEKVLYLDLPVEIAQERQWKRSHHGDVFAQRYDLAKVQKRYLELSKVSYYEKERDPRTGVFELIKDRYVWLDAQHTPLELFDMALSKIESILSR